MAVTLPSVDLGDLSDISELPRKVRTVEPAKSPYQPLIQASLDAGKPKAFPGEYSLTAKGDSKTSEFTAITRELGRAARQMGLRVKTRKIVNEGNADLVRIVFSTFRDDKNAQNGVTDAPKPSGNGAAPATVAPTAAQNAPSGERKTAPAPQRASANR